MSDDMPNTVVDDEGCAFGKDVGLRVMNARNTPFSDPLTSLGQPHSVVQGVAGPPAEVWPQQHRLFTRMELDLSLLGPNFEITRKLQLQARPTTLGYVADRKETGQPPTAPR